MAPLDDETVPSDLNLAEPTALHVPGVSAEISIDNFVQLLDRDGRKARIRVGDRAAEMSDDAGDRPVVSESSQATAQLGAAMDRHERAALCLERSAVLERRLALARGRAPRAHVGQWPAAGVDRRARTRQNTAAARYPTTDDLSPETSPESAYRSTWAADAPN